VAYAQQWALGTPHTSVLADVLGLMARPGMETARLLFDATGVGAVYEDLFRTAYRADRLRYPATPIILTAGIKDKAAHLAKRNVVGKYEAKLSNGEIAIRHIPLRDEIAKQHKSFRAKFSQSGADTYEALRDGRDHDDLVVALMLATYWKFGAPERYLARDGQMVAERALSSDPY